MKIFTLLSLLFLLSCSSSIELDNGQISDPKESKPRVTKRDKKHIEVDVNAYLGITLNSLDLSKNKICIDVFNIDELEIKASYPESRLEGSIVIKTNNEVATFVEKNYNQMRQCATWFNPQVNMPRGKIIRYTNKLEDYVDLYDKTNMKLFLEKHKGEKIQIKIIGDRYMVYPSWECDTMSALGSIYSTWHEIKL